MNIDFISTAESHYKAKMDEAGLTMKLYMSTPVGIGEHPQVFEEFRIALEKYNEARGNFQFVQELKSQYVKASQESEESNNED
tara:strand:- start:3496 stop:3744 length:249 start_codon:yes stop_codon:yes gene_type:complete